jgi:starch synthase
MQVLAVASEIFPLVKTGGLADVTGALPLALVDKGIIVRTLIPGYPGVTSRFRKKKALLQYEALHGGPAAVYAAEISGLELYVLDAPHLFDRVGGPYANATGVDWADNWRRFAALSRVGADIAGGGIAGYRPDIVHAHDWQAALTLAYIHYDLAANVPTVMTVHNLAFQGQFGAEIFDGLGLPPYANSIDGVEYYGGVGYLKAGLLAATAITTVSPTYAQEIRTPEFGMGLQGLLTTREPDTVGIVNGIDVDIWNSESDPMLAARYSSRTMRNRAINRRAVEERFRLDHDDSPLLCVVSRLTWQKGLDVVTAIGEEIVGAGAKLAVLGSGEPALEQALLLGALRHPGRVGVVIGYDETLSHLMQGGCDAILIPSRFEPCGLTQLYGLRYGCVPVVARTGGLADTVIDANEAALAAGVATGFQFAPNNADSFIHAIRRVVATFAMKPTWMQMQKQGMKADVSWARSADRYVELYNSLIAKGQGQQA